MCRLLNAQRVSVIWPFNGWDSRRHAYAVAYEGSGIWELFIP
ncbi:MAG: hypothetical protein R2932_46235 [Caldilineaceae bacterium]